MGMNKRQLEELLAARALEAVDDHERKQVDEALLVAADAELDGRLDRHRAVVAAIATGDSELPDPAVRSATLRAIMSTPSAADAVPSSSPVDVYRNQVRAMTALLAGLLDEGWASSAAPYAWTVQGLVAHLSTIERYMGSKLGIDDFEPPDGLEDDHLGMGEHVIAEELGHSPIETFATWRNAAEANLGALEAMDEAELRHHVRFHAWSFTWASLLVARSFEIWTHVDDISRANGLALTTPGASDLKTMSTVSVASLATIMGAVGRSPANGHARFVLTGPGGGVHLVGFGEPGDAPLATVVTDVVDYCRVAAQRIQPIELEMEVAGDRDLALALLHAAAAFAV